MDHQIQVSTLMFYDGLNEEGYYGVASLFLVHEVYFLPSRFSIYFRKYHIFVFVLPVILVQG